MILIDTLRERFLNSVFTIALLVTVVSSLLLGQIVGSNNAFLNGLLDKVFGI